MSISNKISIDEQVSLFNLLLERFDKNMQRHPSVDWLIVEKRLATAPSDKLFSLNEMEKTGGEPDVVGISENGEAIFYDCSAESPKGRRSLCYDRAALDSRKEFKPVNAALDLADEIGITILNEEEYRFLQTLGSFDLKTSSWVLTPEPIRKLGGAIFCDRRYNHIFTYHNGAESYYASRGFRGVLYV